MQLILVRHGRAEERGTRSNDDDRELTMSGREILRKTGKGLRRLIPAKMMLHMYSSSLPRAWQTAEILATILEIDSIDAYDGIQDGNLISLVAKWDNYTPKDCLLIIGHQPYLGEWSESICGFLLPFKKASAAGYDLTATNPPQGLLRWFVQPKELADLG